MVTTEFQSLGRVDGHKLQVKAFGGWITLAVPVVINRMSCFQFQFHFSYVLVLGGGDRRDDFVGGGGRRWLEMNYVVCLGSSYDYKFVVEASTWLSFGLWVMASFKTSSEVVLQLFSLREGDLPLASRWLRLVCEGLCQEMKILYGVFLCICQSFL
ncbi:hypothetical protein AALP_AAs70636U000600 [Arabis alpina]|uniref:Uncharacterized protein n=1 Tax=Arabis alpina TaxID=50452 RepID=A0A087G1A8_ARAAL|nr:hypothetical protein AALP_AAs70636U000600 [Arabis alpina]